jgi:hypothetical protein
MRYVAAMSNTEITSSVRDAKGRFLVGNKPPGGRPKGSRNKLAENFVADLRDCWETHGIRALERCATEEPAQFVRVVASLMPRTLDLNIAIDVASFADRFAAAAQLLGHDIDPPRLRRHPLPGQRIIEHGK